MRSAIWCDHSQKREAARTEEIHARREARAMFAFCEDETGVFDTAGLERADDLRFRRS